MHHGISKLRHIPLFHVPNMDADPEEAAFPRRPLTLDRNICEVEYGRLSQMPEWSRHDGFEDIPSFVSSLDPNVCAGYKMLM